MALNLSLTLTLTLTDLPNNGSRLYQRPSDCYQQGLQEATLHVATDNGSS